MLCSFAHVLKEDYFPFVADTMEVMELLMTFYNDKVRSYAISCMPEILQSAVSAMEVKRIDLPMVQEVFSRILTRLLACFTSEFKTGHVVILVGALHHCLDIVGELARECLDQKALQTVGSSLLVLLTESHKKIHKREERAKRPDFDEEAYDRMLKDNEEEDELHSRVADCLGSLIKTHGEAFLPTLSVLFPEIVRMLEPGMTVGVKMVAVYVLDDMIEALGQQAQAFFPHFVPLLIEYCSDFSETNAELRQACAYGLALLATYGEGSFNVYVEPTLKVLLTGLGQSDARSEDNLYATDNMAVALGCLAQFHNHAELWPTWLQQLPLGADTNEGPRTYTLLCDLMEATNPFLLGESMENLPKIVSVMLAVVDEEEWLGSDEQLLRRIFHLLHQMHNLPGDTPQALLAALSQPDAQKFQNIIANSPGIT